MLALISLFGILSVWNEKLNLRRAVFYTLCISLIALTFFNADAFIAQQNSLYLNGSEKQEGLSYLTGLSADAVPYYIDRMDEKEYAQYKDMFSYYGELPDSFIYYNAGREKAKNSIAAFSK